MNITLYIDVITLILSCYGRYSSYRVKTVGMQEITKLFRFQKRELIKSLSPFYVLL